MKFKPSLTTFAGLLAALCIGSSSTNVQAQEAPQAVFPGSYLMEMLPAGQIVGDGETPVTLYVTALDTAGTPLETSRLKVSASEGNVRELENRGDGLIEMQFTPPVVRESQEIILRMKGKVGSESLDQAWSLQVVPGLGSSLQTAINPPQVILGQDRTASVTFTLPNASEHGGQPNLQFRATAGDLQNVTYLGNGRFTGLYTPPDVAYPHSALITVSDTRSPTDIYGYLSIPLVGKTDFPRRNLPPNSSVILKISGREFGPYPADGNGSVSIPVIVPPGVAKGTQILVANGRTTESSIDLKVPATRRISLFPVHSGIPGDGVNSITLRAVVIEPTGEADPTAAVRFSVSSGEVSSARHEGNGVYSATYKPPTTLRATTASVQVSLDGASGVQSDSFDIDLIPARPSALQLSPDPERLAPRGEGFKLFAKIRGEDGSGLSGRSITYFANGAQLRGSVKDLGNGDYEAAFVTTGRNHVDITGTAMPTATGNPLRGVVLFSSKARLPNDGLSSSLITIVAIDEFGYPVPGVEMDLSVLGNLGNMPDSVTTDSQGLAQVFYTAGRSAGVAHIIAKAGDFASGTAIFQAPASVAPGLILPTGGTTQHRSWVAAWTGVVTEARVEREGAEAPTAVSAADPTKVVTLQVSAQPQAAAPGGTVTLKIDARNADGRGVPGQTLDVMASQGTVAPIQDNGDGTYSASLSLGQSARGDTKVVVSTANGALFQMMRVATVEGTGWEEPVVEEPVVEEPMVEQQIVQQPTPSPVTSEPATASAPPWLRVQLGGFSGQYTYLQEPVVTADGINPLYSGSVGLTGAPFSGFQAAAEAWYPELPFVGVNISYRHGLYVAGWPAQEPGGEIVEIPDSIPMLNAALKGRYLFAQGGLNFYAAASLGINYSDLIRYTWKGYGPPDYLETSVEYKPISASGTSFGVELGGDALEGDLFYSAGYTGAMLGTSVYSNSVDIQAGYSFMPNVFATLGYNLFTRTLDLKTAETDLTLGTLSDSGWALSAGIGYQY